MMACLRKEHYGAASCVSVAVMACFGATAPAAAEGTSVTNGFGLREQFRKEGHYNRYELNDPKAKIIDVDMKRAVVLPFSGAGVKQVSGIGVKVDARGGFSAPDQVCTLIFKKGGQHAVVRVWENKDHRYFVSLKGDDNNPGTEEKPFRSIQHGIDSLLKNDPQGDVYIGGGDHVQKEDAIVLLGEISLYGGFDEEGWLRDPIIQEPVLLPHGFRENWVDDMCERFKDLRRPDHRCHETRIHRERFVGKHRGATLCAGLRRGSRRLNEGSDKTYVDGLTIFGCPHSDGIYQPAVLSPRGKRIKRNLILVPIYSNTRAPSTGGSGVFENCIIWGGYVGYKGNARHQTILSSSALFRRSLIVGAIGSRYHRMIHNWYNVANIVENQIHIGKSFGGPDRVLVVNTGIALWYEEDHTWIGNLIFTEYLTRELSCPGLIFRNNTVYLRKKGFPDLALSRTLTITGNTFYYFPPVTKEDVMDPDIPDLGGKWDFKGKHRMDDQGHAKYVPPKPGEGTKPTVADNRLIETEPFDIRLWCLTDVRKLSSAVHKTGEDAAIRPKDPPGDLKVVAAGRGKVRLTWKKSKDPKIIGYRVRYGQRSNSYANNKAVDDVDTAVIDGLKPGKWYFTVAAHKEGFIECWILSNEVVADVK